jgi:hypothetical protein
MTSLVNYAENGEKPTPELAKKYVLMGGTLYNKPGTDSYYDRRGILKADASYGGNLGTRQYGIRPMPGITSLKTRSLGAYGSLSEATIKFQAWDVKQLEDLSILFLRPGYKVFLEWGWSMYLDTSINGESYKSKASSNSLKSSNSYSIRNSTFKTVDCFDSGITQEGIYKQLESLRHTFSGNYDGVLGSIMNFNYTLMPNGSYECTTVLISIGDTIDTLRMNDTLGISVNEFSSPKQAAQTASTGSAEIKSQFELLMDAYCKLDDNNPRKDNPIISAIDTAINPKDKNNIDPFIYNYKDRVAVEQLLNASTNLNFSQILGSQYFVTSPVNNGTLIDKRSYYYIQFSYLLHILNVFKNVFADRDQKLVNIEIPTNDPKSSDYISNGLCQASFNSISIDPNTVIIRNSKATLFTDVKGDKGFRPEVYKTETPAVTVPMTRSTYLAMPEFLYGDTNFGIIGNVYINIKEAINIYHQQIIENKGYVYVGKYISSVLDKVSFSLGSINDFDKFIQDDKIVIIDKHYTELPEDSNYNSKYKINVSGNNSIVRNHKIESKIFPSQASMIAIAAQDKENIGAIQTSTYNYLNKGLEDRLFGNKATRNEEVVSKEEEVRKNKLTLILNLIQFVNNYVVPNASIGAYYSTNVGTMNSYLNTLLVEMEGGTDYKAIVPISVDLTTDGFSGLTIGEIFTVDKKVLPRDYENKAVGFIVIGISNEVATNGWTTNLSSQMCLLDQQEKQVISKKKAEDLLGELLKLSNTLTQENADAAARYNVLAAIVVDIVNSDINEKLLFNIDNKSIFDYYIKKTNYSKITCTEQYGDPDVLWVFDELSTTYEALYPTTVTKEDVVIAGRQTPSSPTQITAGYLVQLRYDRPLNTTKATKITRSRYLNIKQVDVLLSIIKENSVYKDMVPAIRQAFDAEYNAFMSDVASGGVQSTRSTAATSTGSPNTSTPTITSYNFTSFRKLDYTKVMDSTGLLVNPLPYIKGYSYLPPKKNPYQL